MLTITNLLLIISFNFSDFKPNTASKYGAADTAASSNLTTSCSNTPTTTRVSNINNNAERTPSTMYVLHGREHIECE